MTVFFGSVSSRTKIPLAPRYLTWITASYGRPSLRDIELIRSREIFPIPSVNKKLLSLLISGSSLYLILSAE